MPRKIIPVALPDSPVIENLADFGAHIRSMRTQAEIRIDDAAALCGVSVQLLSDLENGNRPVGLDKALQVARKLGLAMVMVPRARLQSALPYLKKPT